MRNLFPTAVVLLCCAVGTERQVSAAPLADAQAAFAAKQYAKVDQILAAELAGKSPSAEALKVSLDAAAASGRTATAASRVTTLLKLTGDKDPVLLTQGARLADAMGDTHVALLRYLSVVRLTTVRSDVADEAFLYILRKEAYPDEYKKYVTLFGTDARAWAIGQTQLAKLIDNVDGDRALDLAAYLMQTFPDPARVSLVHQTLYGAAASYVFGKEPKDRWLKPFLVMTKGEPLTFGHLEPTYSQSTGAMTEPMRVRMTLDMLAHFQRPLSTTFLQQLGTDMRALKTDDAKLAAAKEYLTHEPAYAKFDDKGESYYWYLRQIGESPSVFNIKDKALITGEALAQKLEVLKQKVGKDAASRINENVQWISTGYLNAVPAARAAFLRANIAFLNRDQVGDLQGLTPTGNFQQLVDQWAQGKPFGTVVDGRFQQIHYYADQKDKANLIAAARDYVYANPGTFSAETLRNYLINSPLLDANEKLAFLSDAISKGGYSTPIRDVINAMAQDQANWGKNAAFTQLKADFDKKPAGADPLMRTLVQLATIPANRANPDNAAVEAAKKCLAEYPGRIPAGEDDVKNIQELQVQQLFSLYSGHVWDNAIAVGAMADLWLPRTPIGGLNWRNLVTRTREHGQVVVLQKLIPIYAKAAHADKAKNDPLIWQQFVQTPVLPGQTTSPFTEAYDLLTADQAMGWLYSQRDVWNTRRQYVVDEMAKAVAVPGAKLEDWGLTSGVLAQMPAWGQAPDLKVPPALLTAMWTAYLANNQKTNLWDPTFEGNYAAVLERGGKEREPDLLAWLKTWQELLAKRPVEQQINAWAEFFRLANGLPAEPANTPPTVGLRHHLVFEVVKPLYQQATPRVREQLTVSQNIFGDIMTQANALPPADPKTDPKIDAAKYPQAVADWKAAHADAVAYAAVLVNHLRDGARFDGQPQYAYALADILTRDALAKDDILGAVHWLADYATFLGSEATFDGWWTSVFPPLQKLLDEKKADEPTYVFLESVQKRAKLPESVAKPLMLVKAKAGTQIPGIIPVGADDPSYDLFLAAHDLSIGDEGQAWDLTRNKLKLLTQTWPGMDPSYVAWSVDQLRKQKMLKDGLEFAFNILLHEAEIDPDTASHILLTKGDIYRDMENYQAARIEYEGLRNNNRYNKTEAGAKAIYRLIDLHIVTKDYNAAESLLEHLVDADTVQKQADAYYLYAKMSFQKGDFKESRDYLKKVKERVLNHVESALLEGELNLVLPGGLVNTEVAIGDPRLATIVIPGRPLTLTLQDPNLSIARGGAAIPVVVTTSKGGDVEHVKLLPSSSNKNLFTAKIATALGKAQKDDVTLELRGDDVVSYEIEPEFQKANDLKYPAKRLDIRFDARLTASSGEILSEEEQEKRELERQLEMRQAGTSRRFEVARDGRTVRPGSPIYVQITDFCRDISDAPDKIKVDLKTGIGDVMEGIELTETGPHTGVFRAAVPTGIPLPRATASDTETGKTVATIIRTGNAEPWVSLADGRKGKWIEVDTMGSHEVDSISVQIPKLDQVKDLSFFGLLADDYQELATFPARTDTVHGGLSLEIALDQSGDTIELVRRHLKLATTATQAQDTADFDRERTPMKGHDGWMTNRVKGAFYVAENRAIDFKWMSAPPPQDWLRCHLLIDGQEVMDGLNVASQTRGGRAELAKGVHTYELLVRDYWSGSKVVVGYKTNAGTYEPVPADWFSIKAHPELAEYLRPKGKISVKGDVLTLAMDAPQRLRKVRLVFNDFLGNSVSATSFAVTEKGNTQVVPLAKDAVAAAAKTALQISPGDTITVSYNDEHRLHEESKVVTTQLNSSYYNGKITLAEEHITGTAEHRETTYLDAKRCRRGDQLAVIVTDYDEDTTDERDTVPVTVTTSSGEKLVVSALETQVNYGELEQKHAGAFIAILKIGDKTGKDTIKVSSGDKITVSYLDKENTDPGIPIERKYTISEAGAGKPEVVVYRTRVKMVEDLSPEAKARLKRIAGKEVKGAVLYKPLTIARHPDYVELQPNPANPAAPVPPVGQQINAAVNAPLLFEVNYPEHVLNAGSVLQVTAVAESELKAAAAEKREPKTLTVPAYVYGIERLANIKGYPIQLQSLFHKDEKAMLRDGAFAGVIRLQVGSPGDPLDELVVGGEREFARTGAEADAPAEEQTFWYKVPALIVAGSDTVHLRIKDDSGQVAETNVRLLSDARLELMDPTYAIGDESIHLGEKFHIKLTDPDHDVTNDRDIVKLRVRGTSGGDITLALTETLPHSGVFTGNLLPEFIGEPAKGATTKPTTKPGGETLYVNFGDEVTFEYVDDLSLESSSPVTVIKKGRVLFGADAQLAVFTKKFKDPEIAVKTRFLMAEALFETAKEHRKLNEAARADEEISHGKRILEEAIRDYPNTSLAAQGDYLLANLAQELGNYQEAVGRYSNVIGTFPDSEYAAQSQFKKALCFEKLQNYDQSVEEYVKLTYIYPENPLVPDATVRLGNYYYKKQSFKVAAKIFFNFQQKNPTHRLAAEALFLAAQCDYKLADFREAVRLFQKVGEEYPDDKNVRPEAMYWLADSHVKNNDNVKAYQTFKRVTWDYPDSEWAKRARGRLTEDAFSHMADEQQ